MKVLQINAVYNLSSTGKTTSGLQNYINHSTPHTCKSAFSYGGEANDGFVIGSSFDRNIHGLMSRLTGKQAWFSSSATRALLRYMDEYKPDVVQLRNLHGNFINFPMLMEYIAQKDIPTVITLHDCWFFTGKCVHYTTQGCYKWQTGCYDCPKMKTDNKSWFLDRTKVLWNEKKALFDRVPRLAVVGVSDWITDESKKSPLLENAKLFRRIYNGIDSSKFHYDENCHTVREAYGLQGKKIVLGVSGRWGTEKGIDNIIRLSEMLPENYRIVLVGHIDPALSLPGIIVNIPPTSSVQELVMWYSAADVLMNLSREETFGKVSAEALMCGTPVVCFSTTANPELVGENCGYICKSDSIEEFGHLLIKACENGKEHYFDTCVNFALENFNTENTFREYVHLYEELSGATK